jgi:hypothetical protein
MNDQSNDWTELQHYCLTMPVLISGHLTAVRAMLDGQHCGQTVQWSFSPHKELADQ